MTLAFYLMIGVPLTKNYVYISSELESEYVTIIFVTLMITIPFMFIVLFRYLLIRRARSVENVKLKRQKEKEVIDKGKQQSLRQHSSAEAYLHMS